MARVVTKTATVALLMGTSMLAYAINPTANDDRFVMNEDDTLSGNVLTADTPDSGDGTLQVESFTAPGLAGETFSGVAADGAFTYTPPADFSGRVTFTYRIWDDDFANGCVDPNTDAANCFDTAEVRIDIDPVNDAPFVVAPVPALNTDEDVDLSVDLSGLFDDVDIDTDGDILTFNVIGIAHSAVSSATFTGSTLNIELSAHAFGVGTIDVRAVDGAFAAASTTLTLTVDPVNDAPVLALPEPTINTDEDVDATLSLAGLFDDVDGDSLTLTASTVHAAIDSVSINGTDLEVVVAADANGAGAVDVTATDPGGLSVTANIAVNVNAQNDAPFIAGIIPSGTTDEDVDVSISLIGLFDDVDIATNADSLTLEVAGIAHAAVATASIAGGSLDLTLTPDANGVGSIDVRAQDLSAAMVIATIPLTVNPVNDAPYIAMPVPSLNLDEDTGLVYSLAGLFDDADGEALTLTVSTTHPAIDTASIAGTDLTITVIPDANGTGFVDVTATDASGESVTANIPVSVDAVNEAPVIVGVVPTVTTDEDTDTSVSLAGLFDDVDIATNADSLTLSVSGLTNAAIDSATITGTTLDIALLADANGAGTVTVTATDTGALSVDAVISVTVNAVDDAPQLVGVPPSLVTNEEVGVSANLLGLFDDADILTNGDSLTLTVTSVSHPAIASATMLGSSLNIGLLADMIGSGTVEVTASDTSMPALTASATINVTVNNVNDAPYIAGALAPVVVDEDAASSTISLAGLFDDVDIATAGDSLDLAVVATTGTLFSSASVIGGNLVLDYAENQNGSGTVTIRATDSGDPVMSVDYALGVTVNAVNDQPFVTGPAPALVTDEDVDGSVSFAGLFDDVDIATNADSLSYTITGSSHPALSGASIAGTTLSVTVLPNMTGTGTVEITATDTGTPALSVTATFNVTVNSVNDAPMVVGSIAPIVVDEDASATSVSLLGLFDDIDISTVGDTLSLSVTDVSAPGLFASAAVSGSGTDLVLDYAADQNGTASVTVTATDNGVPVLTADYVVTVTVNPVNDAPVTTGAIADVTMDEDDPPLTFPINVFDDVDVLTNGDVLSFSVVNNTDPSLFNSVGLVGEDLTLTVAADQFGTADITIRASDIAGAFVEDTFTVTIVSVNDLPAAGDDAVSTTEGAAPLTISVLGNDYLAEEPTSITAIGPTGEHTIIDQLNDPQTYANGFVTTDGTDIFYEPNGDFFGVDTFTYTITDADGDTSTATVTVTVTNVNDPPTGGTLDDFRMFENQTLTVSVADGATSRAWDVDGKMLDGDGNELGSVILAQLETAPLVGSLTFNQDGSFEYTPPLNFTGVVDFTYRLFDNISLSAIPAYQVRIYVDALPPPPAPPPAGEVETPFNLLQTPLEQSGSVPPNVLVVMDTSGSMDFQLIVEGEDNGGLRLNNDPVNNRRTNITDYFYLWDLGRANTFRPSSTYGRVVPTQAAVDARWPGNGYETWRARSAAHNRIYYNPEIQYEPWVGEDRFNNAFTNADPENIRLDPVDPNDLFDLTASHTYTSTRVPQWDSNGGRSNLLITIPNLMYYWADATTQVVIEPSRTTYPGGANRLDCADDGDPSVCTYAQELQNFANWFQYYRNREYITKGSLGGVVADLQDIRIGYETISNTTTVPVADMNDLHTEGNKKVLMDNIYSVDSFGGTPLRQALDRAGNIFRCAIGNDCPALPEPEGQCQQNFALLFTDGYWNGGAGVPDNTDEDGDGVFDGGRYADTTRATLADVAMRFYETDLWPGRDDQVPVGIRDIQGAPTGYFDEDDTMHQHMKTYAIAFGIDGTFPASDPENTPVGTAFPWTNPFRGDFEKVDDLVHAALNGRGAYYSAANPLQLRSAMESAFLEFTQAASSASAAAFNSTSLREGTLLYRGFYDLRDRTGELTATEVDTAGVLADAPSWRASTQLNPAAVTPDNRVIVTWNPDSGDGVPFRYGNLAPSQQSILTGVEVNYLRGDRSNEQPSGPMRTRPASDGLLGPIINSSPVYVGTPRAINRDQVPFPTDDLYSDFVSDVSNRTAVVYVGANDGMLHGFDASTGAEVIGYVPNKIIDANARYGNKLNDFASPFYFHNYYVDLSPRLNDIYARPSALGAKQWMTTLIGGLGSGGKGFFALNVNDPDTLFVDEASAAGAVLWEFTDDDDTYSVDENGVPLGGAIGAWTDPDGLPVKDLGYATSLPSVQMSNATDGGSPARNEWVAVFGNGMNSTAGRAKLFLLFIDRGVDGWASGDFVKIDTGYGVPLAGEQLEGYPNGLGAPTAVDADLNGTVDFVYAGDRIGNLFRFDVRSDDPADWHAVRLFTATYNDGTDDIVQPILARPLVIKNPDNVGFIVIFGTGSYLTRDDSGDTEIQSIYGIWDRLTSSPATAADASKADRLVEQTITNVVDDSVSPAITRRIVSTNAVEYVADGIDPGTYGWYIDLNMPRAATTISGALNTDTSGQAPPDPQYPGEKAIRRMLFRNGAVITTTVLPASDDRSCFATRAGSILVFDAMSGGDADQAVIDFNTDGVVDQDDLVEVDGVAYSGGLLFDQGDLDGTLVDLSTLGGQGDMDFLFVSGGNDTTVYRIADVNAGRTGRLSWVELDDAD